MHELTQLIREDRKPALGVTEPGAIAYATAVARSYLAGEITSIRLRLNSGMYKNAFTCGIPHSRHVGNLYAAALGAVAGDPNGGLEALSGITEADNEKAERMVNAGIVSAENCAITSEIFIEAQVTASDGTACVTIQDSHTHITRITVNGRVVEEHPRLHAAEGEEETPLIHRYTLAQLAEYARTVPGEDLAFLAESYVMNMALFEEGLASDRTPFLHQFLQLNGGSIFSEDEVLTAQLLCAGAIEARVIGLDKAAMSITGSGAHGIICTMPLLACQQVRHLPQEALWRATALSYLVTMYIKEYSGRLSAFCGCAIAAGTGAACGLLLLWGQGDDVLAGCVRNMAASITGMICDGGNQGCVMKGVTAVDTLYRAAFLAASGAAIDPAHGICGPTPEDTMRYMGRIASPGMVGTEKTILDILTEKSR